MAEENFETIRTENEKGLLLRFFYEGKGVLMFEHQRHVDFDTHPYVNFNITIPSYNKAIDNVEPCFDFLNAIEEKGVRNNIQAFKDMNEYKGTIYENPGSRFHQKFVRFTEFGNSTRFMGKFYPFDAEETKQTIWLARDVGSAIMRTPYGEALLDIIFQPTDARAWLTEHDITSVIRIDGFDSNITDEFTSLLERTAATKILPEHTDELKSNLTNILGEYEPVILE